MADGRDAGMLERVVSGVGAEIWNPWWVATWYVVTVTWIVYGLVAADFSRGFSAFVVLFAPFEAFGVWRNDDAFPPLTHVIRNRFPKWFAFPLIFATVAAVSARWGGLDWYATGIITLAVAALGWLTDHFIATYERDDPRPSAPAPRRAA